MCPSALCWEAIWSNPSHQASSPDLSGLNMKEKERGHLGEKYMQVSNHLRLFVMQGLDSI